MPPQIQGFFDIPVDNLYASPVLVKDIRESHAQAGAGDRLARCRRRHARARHRPPARCRSRDHRQAARARRRVGGDEHHRRCRRPRCILVDDIVDSAGTLCNAAQALIDSGAKAVYAYVTHGVLSGGAVARVASSPIEKLVLTDSIVATEAVRLSHNIRQLTIAPLIAEAMLRISEERSVSSLFN
jgi:ribose-phosphate pyrophosphokinase